MAIKIFCPAEVQTCIRGMAESNAVELKRLRESIYQEHVSSIPAGNRNKLKEKLDFEHEDLEVHLRKIADTMINWIVSLATPLGLSEAEIHAIKSDNLNQTILQQ